MMAFVVYLSRIKLTKYFFITSPNTPSPITLQTHQLTQFLPLSLSSISLPQTSLSNSSNTILKIHPLTQFQAEI